MGNTNTLLEKLMLNRAALMMKKFDSELKEVLHTDVQKFNPNDFRDSTSDDRQRNSTMKNADAIIEKLMLNRATLLIKKFDSELKEVLHTDLRNFVPNRFEMSNNTVNNRLTA